MTSAMLEHVNITVADPDRTADALCKLFDWTIRWAGPGMSGRTVHVGTDDHYIAVYSGTGQKAAKTSNYDTLGGLNHVGVVVDDIDATEARVIAAGYKPVSHADYEPGRRFYFHDADGIEFEVVSYA